LLPGAISYGEFLTQFFGRRKLLASKSNTSRPSSAPTIAGTTNKPLPVDKTAAINPPSRSFRRSQKTKPPNKESSPVRPKKVANPDLQSEIAKLQEYMDKRNRELHRVLTTRE